MQHPDYEQILAHCNYGIIAASLDGRVTHINKKARDLTSFGDRSLEELNISDVLPDSGALVMRSMRRKNGCVVVLGEEKRQNIIAHINVMEEQGKVVGAVCSLFDLTTLSGLDNNFSFSYLWDESFETIFEASHDGLWLCDGEGKVLKINKATENNLAVTREHVIGKRTKDLIGLGLYDKTLIEEVIRTRRKVSQHQTALLTGKQILSTGIPVLDAEGEVSLVVVNERDLSQLIATQQQLEDLTEQLSVEKKQREAQAQAEQMEKMASLGRLAAGIAHEINNPLTSILLFGNMIREKLEQDHKLRKNLDYVLEDAERCKEIVKNLLAYSRQESMSNEVFSFNSLVTDSLGLIHDQRLFLNVAVIKDLEEGDFRVQADKNQLCQVVINLVINAIDAMDMKGTLTLRTRWKGNGSAAVLEVCDTGSGIPEENVAKIFDPFFTTKELGKGTGLGLSMAYGILKENSGRIFVQQTGPEGTIIALELPAVDATKEMLSYSIG